MPLSPRVRQPAMKIIQDRYLTVPAVTYAIGLDPKKDAVKVRNALLGYNYPSVQIIEGLMKFLDLTAEELFDADKIQHAYGPVRKLAVP